MPTLLPELQMDGGKSIKITGIIIAVLLAVLGLIFLNEGRLGDATFALGVVIIILSLITGIWLYVVGILVSAQGQILKASLDSAVNSSPFLTNEQRAKIMSL
jgi:hypothetical protein